MKYNYVSFTHVAYYPTGANLINKSIDGGPEGMDGVMTCLRDGYEIFDKSIVASGTSGLVIYILRKKIIEEVSNGSKS